MPLKLRQPLETKSLDTVRIAAFKFEDNKNVGTQWVEIWVVIGRMNNGLFEQFNDPITGKEHHKHIKIENGLHPLNHSMSLGRCDICGRWSQYGECSKTVCTGIIKPYDGMERLRKKMISPGPVLQSVKGLLYDFLINEIVPHPATFEPIQLLNVDI